LLIVINLDESQLAQGGEAATRIDRAAQAAGLTSFLSHASTAAAAVCAKIELEIGQLDASTRPRFSPISPGRIGLDRVIRASYDLLGYISFFTVARTNAARGRSPATRPRSSRPVRFTATSRVASFARGRQLRPSNRARIDGACAITARSARRQGIHGAGRDIINFRFAT